MRNKIDQYWRERIKDLAANPPDGRRLTDKKIADALAAEARDHGRDDFPSERSVNRYRKDFESEPDAVREYQRLRWPESMRDGLLPWAASAATIELIRFQGFAPPVRVARWFYRATLAAPDAPVGERFMLAHALAFAELRDDADALRGIERYLIYAPWRSREARERYERDAGANALQGITVPMTAQTEAEAELIEAAITAAFSEREETTTWAKEETTRGRSSKGTTGDGPQASRSTAGSASAKRSTAKRKRKSAKS